MTMNSVEITERETTVVYADKNWHISGWKQNMWCPHLQSKSKLLYDWRSVSQSVCLGVEPTLWLVARYYFLSESCCLASMGHPLWWVDGPAVCSVITQWSESRRMSNHTLLSHLRLPQPGGLGSCIYIPQEQGDPVIPLGTVFPLCRFLRLAGLRWRYSNLPPQGNLSSLHCCTIITPQYIVYEPDF
jgi:hypothetical protein